MKKRIVFILLFFILCFYLVWFFVVGQMHSASDFYLSIDGNDMTLQDAIDNDLFVEEHTYTEPSFVPNPGHTVDEIWISIDDGEMTLQDALETGYPLKLDSSFSGYSSTDSAPDVYHLASEIELDSEESFQDLINSGELSCVSNLGDDCGECGGEILCDGSCSVSTPSNYGDSCYPPGVVKDCYDPGTINCDGNCEGYSCKGTNLEHYKYCDGGSLLKSSKQGSLSGCKDWCIGNGNSGNCCMYDSNKVYYGNCQLTSGDPEDTGVYGLYAGRVCKC